MDPAKHPDRLQGEIRPAVCHHQLSVLQLQPDQSSARIHDGRALSGSSLSNQCDAHGHGRQTPGEMTVKGVVAGVTVGCLADAYAALAANPPDQVITP